MGKQISFEELWDEHSHADLFLRDHDGVHGEALLKQYAELPPRLQEEFRAGLSSVVARRSRGWEAARGYLEVIRSHGHVSG